MTAERCNQLFNNDLRRVTSLCQSDDSGDCILDNVDWEEEMVVDDILDGLDWGDDIIVDNLSE